MFKKIGKALGPFDLAAIPIAAYGSAAERYFGAPQGSFTGDGAPLRALHGTGKS